MIPLRLGVFLFCTAILFALTGCPEEQVTTATVAEPIPIPSQPAAPPPNPHAIELSMGQSVRTDGCDVQLLTFSGERPSVLMIKSYADAQQEQLPSAMLQAHVSAREPASLIGSTVKADVYLMTAGEGDAAGQSAGDGALAGVVWHTPPGQPADLRITSFDGQIVKGEIVSGQMINTLTQQVHPLTGRFSGPLQ